MNLILSIVTMETEPLDYTTIINCVNNVKQSIKA